MHDSPQANSALDAVRYLYLAKVAEREGHADAAGRWRQMADGWLDRLEDHTEHDTTPNGDSVVGRSPG